MFFVVQCVGNELHHSGWNTCSSCFEIKDSTCATPKRDKLVCPSLNSNRIYVFDMSEDARKPKLYREIDGSVLLDNDVSAPHTSHCLADGTVLVSTMGDANGNAKGDFIQFDSEMNCLGTWTRGKERPACGYDFWYQPYFDVLVSSEWGAPKLFKRGYRSTDIDNPADYGRSLNFYRLSDHTLFQSINLGIDGITPLEVSVTLFAIYLLESPRTQPILKFACIGSLFTRSEKGHRLCWVRIEFEFVSFPSSR